MSREEINKGAVMNKEEEVYNLIQKQIQCKTKDCEGCKQFTQKILSLFPDEYMLEEIPCPWPESVWAMTDEDYVKAIPDEKLRTAISGFLMRKGWELAIEDIKRKTDHYLKQ
jgi:hypothetical protein